MHCHFVIFCSALRVEGKGEAVKAPRKNHLKNINTIMRKLLTLTAALILGASLMHAQGGDPYDPSGRWNVSVQGGVMGSLSENAFSYNDNGYLGKLYTPQASVAVGYDFNQTYGIRASVGFGKNMSAGNVKQTAVRNNNGFWPYGFKSINAFVDCVINLNGLNVTSRAFAPKFYGGLGYGHSFGFWRPSYSMMNDADLVEAAKMFNYKKFHPTQNINESNHALGFRFGFIAEYNITRNLGIFADICGEAYTDNYNGLEPWTWDHAKGTGYAGFPLDLRGLASFGILLRFN